MVLVVPSIEKVELWEVKNLVQTLMPTPLKIKQKIKTGLELSSSWPVRGLPLVPRLWKWDNGCKRCGRVEAIMRIMPRPGNIRWRSARSTDGGLELTGIQGTQGYHRDPPTTLFTAGHSLRQRHPFREPWKKVVGQNLWEFFSPHFSF